jgi:hypothetical protein
MIIIPVSLIALVVSGCAQVEDDGYLPPPITAFDQVAAIERAHVALSGRTYVGVTKDFDHARSVRITKPSQCVNEFEAGLWSQTEYQEGCRAYALTVLSLIDEYRKKHHERGAS